MNGGMSGVQPYLIAFYQVCSASAGPLPEACRATTEKTGIFICNKMQPIGVTVEEGF